MNCKDCKKPTIKDYEKLIYPMMVDKTDDGYELWYPDFGRGSICLVIESLSEFHEAYFEMDELRIATTKVVLKQGLNVPLPFSAIPNQKTV